MRSVIKLMGIKRGTLKIYFLIFILLISCLPLVNLMNSNASNHPLTINTKSPRSNGLSGIIDLSSEQADLSIYGNDIGDNSGSSLAFGDIDGDNIEDIIIGAIYGDGFGNFQPDCGEVYIIYGDSTSNLGSILNLSTQADITIYGNNSGDNVGSSITTGDIDGDGKDDIIIATYLSSEYTTESGAVYIIFGDERSNFDSEINLSTSADIKFLGTGLNDHTGSSVASGDINNDGKDEIIIGAKDYDDASESSAGAVYVIFGDLKSNLNPMMYSWDADIIFIGDHSDDRLGSAVAVGNVDDDEYVDIIMSATGSKGKDQSRPNSGTTYVVFGNTESSFDDEIDIGHPLAGVQIMKVYGAETNDISGSSLCAGDINGDDYEDIIITASLADGPGNSRNDCGESYIVFGNERHDLEFMLDLLTSAPVIIYGNDSSDELGRSITTGDTDADGVDDIIIGAHYADGMDNNNMYTGESYLIYGDDSLPAIIDLDTTTPNKHADLTIYGEELQNRFGYSVSAGDINNDGFDDIVCGAINARGYMDTKDGAGDTYIFYGEFRPQIRNKGITLENPDINNTCYSNYKPYIFRVNVTDFIGAGDLKSVNLKLYSSEYPIEYSWTANNDEFSEIYDPNNYTMLASTSSDSELLGNECTLDFKIIFNWDYPDEKMTNCRIFSQGYTNLFDDDEYSNLFQVENDIDFYGNLTVNTTLNNNILEGSWVGINEKLTWKNITVVYENTVDIYPQYGDLNAIIWDNDGDFWSTEITPGNPIKVVSITDSETDIEETYKINISGVPLACDLSNVNFGLNVDGDPPNAPTTVTCHADAVTDVQTEFDNDTTIYIDWTDSVDDGSGVAGYYVSLTDYSGTTIGNWTNDTNMIINDVPTGLINVYVWAKDHVNNIGESNSASIFIDLENIVFTNPLPDSNIWQITSSPTCKITITDINGSGVDASTIQYQIKSGSGDQFGDWSDYKEGVNGETIVCSVPITFLEGKENYIRWRAKDIAGNGYTKSEIYQILVDSKKVTFTNIDPTSAEILDNETVTCNITINDLGGSGVNGSSIQYCYSYFGVNSYSDWEDYNELSNEESSNCSITLKFYEGENNYIKWRAKDVAGNGYTESTDIQIKIKLPEIVINYPPKVEITSPENNTTFYTTDSILFDCSRSSDADGDRLTYFWTSNIDKGIGYYPKFLRELPDGIYYITLYVDDGNGHNVSKNITITVIEKPITSPDDEDSNFGMVIGIIIIIIIAIIIIISFYFIRIKHKKDKPQITGEEVKPEIEYIPTPQQSDLLDMRIRIPITQQQHPVQTQQISQPQVQYAPQQIPQGHPQKESTTLLPQIGQQFLPQHTITPTIKIPKEDSNNEMDIEE